MLDPRNLLSSQKVHTSVTSPHFLIPLALGNHHSIHFMWNQPFFFFFLRFPRVLTWAFLIAQLVKNLPAMQETPSWFLGWEDPPEKERLLTPVFWPGEFHGLYSPWGCKESDMTEQLSWYLSYSIEYWAFSVWLISFSITHLVYIVTKGKVPF